MRRTSGGLRGAAGEPPDRAAMGVLGSIAGFIGRLRGRRGAPAPAASPEQVRALFKERYQAFKTLLKANNEAHETMTRMGLALRSGRPFGMAFVRGGCTALSVDVFKMAESLVRLGGEGYRELFAVSERIFGEIDAHLRSEPVLPGGPLVLDLGQVSGASGEAAGGKMASLGEIRSRLGMRVPEGFVISTAAHRAVIESANFLEEVRARMQVIDTDDVAALHRVSADLQRLALGLEIPPELRESIQRALGGLQDARGPGLRLSLRSSAIGEDAPGASFAGQYRTVLNVGGDRILDAYKEVLASKYTVPAITYRLKRGYRDADILMAVGCMEMVDAAAGGVMYSRDPADPEGRSVLISSCWGLATSVVDGSVSPDLFRVSRADGRLLEAVVGGKEHTAAPHPAEGVDRRETPAERRAQLSLTPEQAAGLAALAVRLEEHFGSPQDIEWSVASDGGLVILQSRPLLPLDRVARVRRPETGTGAGAIVEGGVSVSGGAASGPAAIVLGEQDLESFPKGAVLVTPYPAARLSSLVAHAAAVVAERGGITGHLATVAREFDVPALFGVPGAAAAIRPGQVVTVDADGRRVLDGEVPELVRAGARRPRSVSGTRVHATLERIFRHVGPLNLTDPDALEFRPAGCRTVHDVTRYCHEMAVREIFKVGERIDFASFSPKRLANGGAAQQWWVLDLDDGFKEEVEGDVVRFEQIDSVPMRAIWEGIHAVKWRGPPPVDARGFMSIMFEATMNADIEPARESRYADRNYFIVSRHFCNLSSRFGFHFSVIEAYCADWPGANYASFSFKGGAADLARKIRRVEFIGQLLREFGFRVDRYEDAVVARIEGLPGDKLREKLKILGYLVMHTRQIDMVMNSDQVVRDYYERFVREIAQIASP